MDKRWPIRSRTATTGAQALSSMPLSLAPIRHYLACHRSLCPHTWVHRLLRHKTALVPTLLSPCLRHWLASSFQTQSTSPAAAWAKKWQVGSTWRASWVWHPASCCALRSEERRVGKERGRGSEPY